MTALTRRTFLRFGAGAGIGLAAWPRTLAAIPGATRRVRSVIWLWMDGGMSQAHTWDPKPQLKPGALPKAIDTAVPDVQISEYLPLCASRMKDLVLIRSVSHDAGDHEVATRLLHTGEFPMPVEDRPTIGTILAYELGKDVDSPLPKHVSVNMPAIELSTAFDEAVQPFTPNRQGAWIPNLHRNVDRKRDDERVALLLRQNAEWMASHQQRAASQVTQSTLLADRLMNTPLLKTFNVAEEPADVRAG